VERILITGLVQLLLDGVPRVRLYEPGPEPEGLLLLDAGVLATVGIDPAALPIGVRVPCCFWAHCHSTPHAGSNGRSARSVVCLEPWNVCDDEPTAQPAAPGPANPAAIPDLAPILDELRAINATLHRLTACTPTPASSTARNDRARRPAPVRRAPSSAAPADNGHGAQDPRNFPTSPRELLTHLRARGLADETTTVLDLYDSLGVKSWPAENNLDAWRSLLKAATGDCVIEEDGLPFT